MWALGHFGSSRTGLYTLVTKSCKSSSRRQSSTMTYNIHTNVKAVSLKGLTKEPADINNNIGDDDVKNAENSILKDLVTIAENCGILSIRGTALHVLGII